MRKRILWLLVSGLLVLALVLVSCGPAVTEEEEEEEVVTEEEEEIVGEEEEEEEEEGPEMVKVSLTRTDGTTMERWVETPKYGGTFNMVWSGSATLFDDALGHPYRAYTTMLTHDVPLQGDWGSGAAGTGEVSFMYMVWPEVAYVRGGVVESWEMPDENTLVFHLRQGVHFHDKPPTNGREMTADDVAFSLNRLWTLPTSIYLGNPYIESIEATDKYTVTIKIEPGRLGVIYRYATQYPKIMPRDAIEEFGDMGKWQNAIGTGPFTLTDHVDGSSSTLTRNPNYWDYDPVHPQNQLPYLDTVKYLIITDLSTRLAAMRTAKIDWITGVGWEDAPSLMETSSTMQYAKYGVTNPPAIFWRVDMPELPFYDVKVRQALFMAIDHETIARDYYGGQAEIYTHPAVDIPEFSAFYVGPEDYSEVVGKMYGYHPDEAKRLLAEAGYPDGFKASIVCVATQVDLLSIVKNYWEQVGVELTFEVKETAAYTSLSSKKEYDLLMGSAQSSNPEMMSRDRIGNIDNYSMIADPLIEEAYAGVTANFFDTAKKAEIYRGIFPRMLEQAYYLVLPGGVSYSFWWPWVKNYNGERYVGTWAKLYNFPQWIWIDQDLKEEMTGKR